MSIKNIILENNTLKFLNMIFLSVALDLFLDNKLILITNADPGYDFIFNYKIKGLITMYGGSNSHMAIRCLEQNIPAAIGVGKLKYQEVLNSHKMSLDCLKEKLYVIN